MRFIYARALFPILTMLVIAISLSTSSFEETFLPPATVVMAQSQPDAVWQINDTIKLTRGRVEWSREGYNPQPPQFIEDGFSLGDYAREWLIDPGDLFLRLYEDLNWTKVRAYYWCSNKSLGEYGTLVSSQERAKRYKECQKFDDWADFEEYVTNDPAWWLSWAWGLDSLRYGVSANSTIVDAKLEGDKASVTVSCHVTQVAEYLIGRELRVGDIFDLRSISLGKLETYERVRDFTSTDRSFHYHFSVPSNILQEKGELYTATIPIDVFDQKKPSIYNRNIIIMMPPTTEVTEATPSAIAKIDKNMAIFTIQQDDLLPISFTVKSMPIQKTLLEMLLNPQVLTGIFTAAVAFPSVIQGVRMIKRRRTYGRLMRLSVKLYHEYRSSPDALEKEMNNLTESIFTSFIEDKLTDEQLEKLLHRRDDLLARLRSGIPPSS